MITNYIKWLGTASLIGGAVTSSLNLFPLDISLFMLGSFLWVIVGLKWREWSLVVLNTIMTLIYVIGIVLDFNGINPSTWFVL